MITGRRSSTTERRGHVLASTLTVPAEPGGERPPAPPEPAASEGRRANALWHLAGLSLFAYVMLWVTDRAVEVVDGGLVRLDVLRPATVVTGVVALVAAAAAVAASLAAQPAASGRPVSPIRLLDVWRRPPGDWPAFALGAGLALPLLGLFTPVGLGDSDSVRLVAAVRHVQRDGIGYLIDIQDNLVPHLVLAPAASLGGLEGVRVVTILSLQVLAGVVAYVARRLSGSMAAGALAAVALLSLPAVVARASYVPMYPTMLAFGTLGAWLCHEAMQGGAHRRPSRVWLLSVAAAACLVAALESQSVGQLFLASPVLLLPAAPSLRQGLRGAARIYGAVAVLMVPRVLINTRSGGLSHMTSNRTDYWITEGYVRQIQSRFWHYEGVDESLGTYLAELPGRFVTSLGTGAWVALALAGLGLVGLRGRARAVLVTCVLFMALAATVKRVPPFARYFSPLWPGLAIVAGIVAADLLRRRPLVVRALGLAAGVLLVVTAVRSFEYQAEISNVSRARIEQAPFDEYVELIDERGGDRGVVGARSHVLVNASADVPTYGGQFLTEDEYVTYLTWPSDGEVVDLLRDHDIGWVLVSPKHQLELQYHDTWLVPNHGRSARHLTRLKRSPEFCLVDDVQGYDLYRLGSCPS
jgi:hypothetical protein